MFNFYIFPQTNGDADEEELDELELRRIALASAFTQADKPTKPIKKNEKKRRSLPNSYKRPETSMFVLNTKSWPSLVLVNFTVHVQCPYKIVFHYHTRCIPIIKLCF
jgi:hypothetical protein